jgi:hypothetical protein
MGTTNTHDMTFRLILLTALTALPFVAHAAEPVRHVAIHVQPYYEAAREPGGQPRVAVGNSFAALASNRREDIVAVRDRIIADSKLATPMTLMVLAIRLYDVGLRDDAVFWFYAAKDRFLTLDKVVDVGAGGLAQVEDAIRNFSTLAGPIINGYAFCDIANQQAIRARALDWVENNPYEVIFSERLPAKASNRKQALAEAVAQLRQSAAKESAYLQDAANVAKFRADRARNGADEKYCWKP